MFRDGIFSNLAFRLWTKNGHLQQNFHVWMRTLPSLKLTASLHLQNGWLEDDPFGARPMFSCELVSLGEGNSSIFLALWWLSQFRCERGVLGRYTAGKRWSSCWKKLFRLFSKILNFEDLYYKGLVGCERLHRCMCMLGNHIWNCWMMTPFPKRGFIFIFHLFLLWKDAILSITHYLAMASAPSMKLLVGTRLRLQGHQHSPDPSSSHTAPESLNPFGVQIPKHPHLFTGFWKISQRSLLNCTCRQG